jgi:hypothetical protein
MTSLLSADEGIGVQASGVHLCEVSKGDPMTYSPAAPEVPLPETTTSREIPAYFALEFPDVQFTYYLQKLLVSLGRSDAAADIDLGALKNISRLHARIEYEEQLEQFVLAVMGRNGAFVDSVWHEPGERVPLAERWVENQIIISSANITHSGSAHQFWRIYVTQGHLRRGEYILDRAGGTFLGEGGIAVLCHMTIPRDVYTKILACLNPPSLYSFEPAQIW